MMLPYGYREFKRKSFSVSYWRFVKSFYSDGKNKFPQWSLGVQRLGNSIIISLLSIKITIKKK